MKFLHLSDLHIGIRLYHYDLREDQRHIFGQILEYVRQEQPDAVVIAGDIYDKAVPSAEAVELFDEFITQLCSAGPGMAVMMISGNHDSAQRIDCLRTILSQEKVYMVGLPPRKEEEFIQKVTLEDSFGPVHFYLLPFVKPSFVREITGEERVSYDEAVHRLLEREEIEPGERNVLVSHQFYVKNRDQADQVERAETEILTVGNIDSVASDCLEPFDYAALGHIHKPMKAGGENFRYCGTPMAYSLSEEGQEKAALLVNLGEKGTPPEITPLSLKPLRRVRRIRGTFSQVCQMSSQDYVWISLTEKADLDVNEMQVRLRNAFPYLLGVRNENAVKLAEEDLSWEQVPDASAFELFQQFCPDLDEEERELIQEIIHSVKGVL